MAVGGLSVKYNPMLACTVSTFPVGFRCMFSTRSLPGSSRQGCFGQQRRGIGLPEKKMAVRIKVFSCIEGDFHSRHALLPILGMGPAQRRGPIDKHISVVNHSRRSRTDFHRPNIPVFSIGTGRMKLRNRCVPCAGTVIGNSAFTTRSGGPSCQSFEKTGGLGVAAFPSRHSAVDPGLNRGNVRIRQPAIIGEVSEAGFREPRRHETAGSHRPDQRSPTFCVSIRLQAERPGTPGVVASGAILIKDGRHLLIERDGRILRTHHRREDRGETKPGKGTAALRRDKRPQVKAGSQFRSPPAARLPSSQAVRRGRRE